MAKSIQQTRQISSLGNPRQSQSGNIESFEDFDPVSHPIAQAEIPSTSTSRNAVNDALDPNSDLTPFERNQIFTRAAAGDDKALIQLAKAGILERSATEPTPSTMLALVRAGLDIATQYLPQGTEASRIATGARGLINNLGLPGAEADPRVEDYTNTATRGITTVRNILGGF
jgi:hypothetical protein